MQTYDHIILGSGLATTPILSRLIPTGESIAVVEGGPVGGTCINYGCTPTKTLVGSAKAIHMAKRAPFYGFETGDIRINYAKVIERMDAFRFGLRDKITGWIESTPNTELIRGWGKFIGPKRLQVGDRQIEGKRIYINTGTTPFIPPIEGIDQVNYLENSKLIDLKEIPTHLIIVGGGYIGLEFAQIFSRFGSKITIVQRQSHFLPQEDEDITKAIQEFLEEEGVRFIFNAKANAVKESNGVVALQVITPDGEETLTGSHLAITAGRKPNSDLNLEVTKIKTNDRGFIIVDDHCQTGEEGVFAVGDVNGHGAFTHTAVNDGEIVTDNYFGGNRKLSDRIPTFALFTDPPLGRTGMNEKQALASGKRVLKAVYPFANMNRAVEMGETKGFIKILVDGDTDLILGVSVLGLTGDEIVNIFTTAMYAKMTYKSFRKMMFLHPTISEIMPFVLDGLEEVK